MDVIELIDERYAGRQIAQPTIALVPTMGALHAGHLALIDYAKTLADEVWVSIFVNPTQFGPNEDFQRYPRTLEADLAACKAHGVSTVFIPSVEMLYPQGPGKTTLVIPPADLASGYCGQSRLGHFAGVATIVLKLFNLVQPNIVIFGEKDAQQLAVIRRMVADLNLPVNVMGHPIVREADGLAMSSRNRYLTTRDARQAALTLFHVLQTIKHCVAQGETSLSLLMTCREHVKTQLLPEIAALIQWEYIAAVVDDSFQPATQLTAGVRILVAARIVDAPHGVNVRLIDNQVL